VLDRLRLRRVCHERATDPEPAGTYAVHAIRKVNDETHAEVLALVDELIAMGFASGGGSERVELPAGGELGESLAF
jgi:argonaute-like protein implicated in RNA metabolism and viral defense